FSASCVCPLYFSSSACAPRKVPSECTERLRADQCIFLIVTSEKRNSVAIIGGDGEFGQFLRHDILPVLGVSEALVIERDTPATEATSLVQSARHVVLATPLAGYAERACDLIYTHRGIAGPATFWFIPSVQAGVWRAVSATLEIVGNPDLSAVFLHP